MTQTKSLIVVEEQSEDALSQSLAAACAAAAHWWAALVLTEIIHGVGREGCAQMLDINAFDAALQEELLQHAEASGYLSSFQRFAKHPRGFRISMKVKVDAGVDPILVRAGAKAGIELDAGRPTVYLPAKIKMMVTPYHVWVENFGPVKLIWWARGKEKQFYS